MDKFKQYNDTIKRVLHERHAPTTRPDKEWDERRGIHLLSPRDLVRWRGGIWNVTGVFLETEASASIVTMVADGDPSGIELKVPLLIVESCEIFLRARATAPPASVEKEEGR